MRSLSPTGLVSVDCLSTPVLLESPFATSRMIVAAIASNTSKIEVANTIARALE